MATITEARKRNDHKLLMQLATRNLAALIERRRAYDRDVDEWYSQGDGRSPKYVDAYTQPWFEAGHDDPYRGVNIGGKGYRYPVCIHGRSLWVDHDCNCGACEDGASDSQIAMEQARGQLWEFQERLAVVRRLADLNAPSKQTDPLWTWCMQSVVLSSPWKRRLP